MIQRLTTSGSCSWRAFPLVLALLASADVLAPASANSSVTGQGTRPAQAVRVDRAPKLDGTLNDPLWQSAEPVVDFRQREPNDGKEATEKTEVRILYTRNAVYFGIHCYDSQPSRIVATELRRDVTLDLDDHIEIMIDSTHSRRGGYVFEVNPLGTQADGLVVDEQGGSDGDDFDRGWDGVWTSEARIGPDGWTATVAIPFSTLNFTHSTDVVWYVNFERFIRWKNEEDLWRAYERTSGIPKVSEAGELTGITDIGSGRLFIIKPYGLVQYDKLTGQNPAFPLTGGLDVKYGLRSNLLLNLTANTDFADTDVDLEAFNLTPFKLFIPEKRQFFLENAGIFDFAMGANDQLFFSRQVGIDPVTGEEVPVNGGAKLTGTIGNTEIGLMDISTRASGLNPDANFAVARVKESLWAGSYIGVIGVDKQSGNPDDSFNQAGGVDTRLVFFKDWTFEAHAAATQSPGHPSGNTDLGASLYYRSNWLDAYVERRKTGANFNPEVGFVLNPDANEEFADLVFKARPKIRGVRELQFEGFLYHAPNTHNEVYTQQTVGTFRVLFDNGGYADSDIANVNIQAITTPLHVYKDVFIPVGVYHFTRHQVSYGSRLDRPVTYTLLDEFGSYYGGTLNEFRVQANYRVNPKFSMSAGETWNRFSLPVPNGNFSVNLANLQGNYSFNRFLTFTSIVQADTANARAVSANVRLRYNYRPDSDLYVIYNIGTQFTSIAPANPPQVRETRFTVKFTYSFFP
jgi:hypothetical protein